MLESTGGSSIMLREMPQSGRVKGAIQDVVDGFRKNPNARITGQGTIRADDKPWSLEDAYEATATSTLSRNLKSRHLQMISIGAAIGASLYITSGKLLATAGPAGLFFAFSFVAIAVYCTGHALGEMAVLFPVSGSFSAYSTRFLDPAWGFAMGWNYAIQWLAIIPIEIVAGSIAIKYWTNGNIANSLWITIFLVLIAIVNLLPVRAYGELEFVLTTCKIISIVGFILFAIVADTGGTRMGFIGGKYWHDPGAFQNGFKGTCSVVVTAALAFAGVELCGLCAAETKFPRQSIPIAVRQIFWRLLFFYIISVIMIGLIVRSDDPRLLSNKSTFGNVTASPFVIAILDAGATGLDSVFNVLIILACFEVGSSAVYASTRTLTALAEQRQAPKFMTYIDRSGRPMASIAVALVIGLFSYLGATTAQQSVDVLVWFSSVAGLASIFTWASICVCHIRFRQAWRLQGHSLNELAFRSTPGVVGSWIALIFYIIILAVTLWISIAPIGYVEMSANERAKSFFQNFLAVPVVLLFFLGYKLIYKTEFVSAKDMNLSIGILKLSLEQILAEERARREAGSIWRRIYNSVRSPGWWLGFRGAVKNDMEMDYGWRTVPDKTDGV
ncbi:MAG: hypothetical protein M1825_001356 [Sarcosagium campestre]|nr:MAG: hypothetical protein M1825_001356 [Sarcosagium campestre]